MATNSPDIFNSLMAGCQPIEYAPGNLHKVLQEAVTAMGDTIKPGGKMEVGVVCKDTHENLYAIRIKVENPEN